MKNTIMKKLQEGATMVEYAILVALIAMAVVATVAAVGTQVDAKFDQVEQCLKDPGNCGQPSEGE